MCCLLSFLRRGQVRKSRGLLMASVGDWSCLHQPPQPQAQNPDGYQWTSRTAQRDPAEGSPQLTIVLHRRGGRSYPETSPRSFHSLGLPQGGGACPWSVGLTWALFLVEVLLVGVGALPRAWVGQPFFPLHLG